MTLHNFEERWLAIIASCQTIPSLRYVTKCAVQKGAVTVRITTAIVTRFVELDEEQERWNAAARELVRSHAAGTPGEEN